MKLLKIALGFIISGLCLWFAFRDFDLADLSAAVGAARWAWFLPAVGMFMIAHTCRTFRWRILLSPIQVIRPLILLPVLLFGFMVNAVMPARAGEFARAFAGARETGINAGSILGTIAAERVTDVFGLFCLMLVALPAFPAGRLPIRLIITVLLLAAAAIAAFLFVVRRFGPALRGRTKGVVAGTIDLVIRVAEGFSALKSGGKIAGIVALTIGLWISETFSVYFVTRAMNMDLSLLQSAALLTGICVGYMVPGAPGAVGTVELFGKQTLVMMGFEPVSATSFILVLHFYQLLMVVLAGIPSMFRLGIRPSEAAPAAA